MATIVTDDIKLCNCAGCERRLLAPDMSRQTLPREYAHMPIRFAWVDVMIGGHVHRRPYCRECLIVKTELERLDIDREPRSTNRR